MVHNVLEKGINFEIKKKVQDGGGLDQKQMGVNQTGFRTSGVFCEPFEPGICIEDTLTKSHRLIFNKYPVQDLHILVTTREKEK